MRVMIRTNSKVINAMTYLEGQLDRFNLNKWKAILYFQTLIDYEEGNIIRRPLFTYKLEDFDEYLDFFVRYNLLDKVDYRIKENAYSVPESWKDKRADYRVSSIDEENFFKSVQGCDELSSYYFTLA